MGQKEIDWLLQTLRGVGFGTYQKTGQGQIVLPPATPLGG